MISNTSVVRKQAGNKNSPVDAVYQVFVIRCSAVNSARNTNEKINVEIVFSILIAMQ